MKKYLIGVFVAVGLAVAVTAYAQYTFGQLCPRCGVLSYVDIAMPTVFAGWGFECESGQPANRIDLYYQADNGWFVPAPVAVTVLNVWRQDVQDAYRPHCPNVVINTGWHVFPQAGVIPSGTRVIAINVWRGPYYEQHRRTVIFP